MRVRKKPWAAQELLDNTLVINDAPEKKGKWKEYFGNDHPIYVEIGCGKGGFIAQEAPANPEYNYIAIDIKNEMLVLAKRKLEAAYAEQQLPLDNVRIMIDNIMYLRECFAETDRLDRIYINFCNPWSKNAGSNKHRLTHPRQLLQYRRLMDEGAEIWFKTDDDDLFRDSLGYFPAAGFEITWQTFDLHKDEPDWNLRTEHEGMFSEQGIPIKALIARKGPDSSVTWVEPKALARQQEAEDESD